PLPDFKVPLLARCRALFTLFCARGPYLRLRLDFRLVAMAVASFLSVDGSDDAVRDPDGQHGADHVHPDHLSDPGPRNGHAAKAGSRRSAALSSARGSYLARWTAGR